MSSYDKNHDIKNDPIKRQPSVSQEDRGAGLSPMAPPEVDSELISIDIPYEQMHPFFQELMDEHRELEKVVNTLEEVSDSIKKKRALDGPTYKALKKFLVDFNEGFVEHNQKEEKIFFPILHKRLLEVGEHSKGKEVFTGVDILQSEHVQGVKLLSSIETALDIIDLIQDQKSREEVLGVIVRRSNELVELMNMHVTREDNIIFKMAMKILTPEDLEMIVKG